MAECDMSNDNSNSGLATAFTSSSVGSENVNSDLKKRKTHRLKQRFQVVRKLGQGTYGKVQLAINNETGQEVAIKTIKKSKVSSQQDLVRIRREIQIMSSINHPNIIHIFEVFENKDKIVLVMQYASGGELYDYVSYHKALSDSEARRIFRQVATAIYYCHKNKICHRDLKLENILLDEKGNAKIADFGLSNVFDDKHFLQTFCGSPLYASPEIVRGLPYFGPEVDCWSLGVLLYTLVYGAMPFDGSNFKKLVKQISEAGYFEPPEKSAATGLIHKLLTPDPKERASIIDICTDEWVNQDSDHLLLQVAEDLSNLTKHAVRLDMLLQLAPGSPTEQPPPKPELSAKVEKNENEDVGNKAKRPNEMVSSSSQNLTDAPKKAKKKTKKSETKEQKQPRQQPATEDKTLTENMEMEKTCELKGDQTSQLNDQASESTNDFGVSMESEKAIFEPSRASEPSNDPNINKNENSVQSGSSKNSLKSNESASSISRRRGKVPISPGLFSVSELKKELEQKTRLIQQQQSPIARRRDTLADTSELKSASQKMKKYQNRSLSLNIQALRSKEELPEQSKISKPFEEIKSETSKLEPEGRQQKPETVRTEFTDGQPASTEEQTTTSKTSSSSSVKDDNNKTLAKQIIQKNIAKAKLMEKRQTSIQSGGSQSGETTPLISIENSTVSVMQSAGTGAESPDTNLFFSKVKPPSTPSNTTNLGCMAAPTPNLPITSAAPITRSYKKVVFTKDGAKITETGKYYSHEGEDGVTTRVEKKSRITHIINNNQNIGGSNNNNNINYNNSSTNSPIGGTIQRSDSQSSTGSIDIFDDIFDDHWTGDNLFSNVKSLFNDFFGPRQEPKLSLRSRTESLERTNWIAGGNGPERSSFGDGNRGGGGFRSTTTTTKFTTSKDHTNSSSNSLFGSQRSLFGAANRQSIFSNSSFSKKTTFGGSDIDDIINSTRSKIDDYRKHGLAKDRFSSSSVAGGGGDDNRSFFTSNSKSRLFDDMDSVDSNRRRVEQWLGDSADATTVDEEDLKDFDLRIHSNYGTIRPQNLRRYARTMTSNDYKSDVFQKVEISNSSSCKVIEQKTSKIKTENLVPRNADVQINFSLDNLIGGGGGGGGGGGKSSFIIMNPTTSSSSIDNSQLEEIFSKKSNPSASSSTTVNVSGSGDLKIEEPSSLLEQLRTLGYQKLVNRRLSDSSDTEDLIASSAMADSGVEQQQQQQQQQQNKPSAK